jgi:hypothetical protein
LTRTAIRKKFGRKTADAPGGWASDREPAKRVSLQRVRVEADVQPEPGWDVAKRHLQLGKSEPSLFALVCPATWVLEGVKRPKGIPC